MLISIFCQWLNRIRSDIGFVEEMRKISTAFQRKQIKKGESGFGNNVIIEILSYINVVGCLKIDKAVKYFLQPFIAVINLYFFFLKRLFKTMRISLLFLSYFRFSLISVDSHHLCFFFFDYAVPFRFTSFSTRTLISFNFFFPYCILYIQIYIIYNFYYINIKNSLYYFGGYLLRQEFPREIVVFITFEDLKRVFPLRELKYTEKGTT